MTGKWQFWVDRGGTFTDVVALSPDNEIHSHKLLSENPSHYQDATLQGIRDILKLTADQPIPCDQIECVKLGTTIATNALLERKGESTALLITQGFADALRIAYQNRPDLFAKEIILPEQLYSEVVEIDERINAAGEILKPINEKSAQQALENLKQQGFNSIAIVLLHAYKQPEHEKTLTKLAKQVGFEQISVSHEVSPLIKLIGRGDTTVVDAYLTPILLRYIKRLSKDLPNVKLYFMQSNGGLTSANFFRGMNSILSGPAGGVVGAASASEAAGYKQTIGFDMGGTSTDLCHYADGKFERSYETEVAGVRIRAPMLSIYTIAAGGGSILSFKQGRFQVGPESAGSNPGPTCYRAGGPLTVTDCNLLLGRLIPDYFPKIFGKDHDQPLDTKATQRNFLQLTEAINKASNTDKTPEEVAYGFLEVAIYNMANAIKKISTQRGYDVTDYVLTCFGGAGGQHACLIAELLGMNHILFHPLAGVLSAYGIGTAAIRVIKQQSIEQELTASNLQQAETAWQDLLATAEKELASQLTAEEQVTEIKQIRLRYADSDQALTLTYQDNTDLVTNFHQLHQQHYGFNIKDKPLVIESVIAELVATTKQQTIHYSPEEITNQQQQTTRFYSKGKWHNAKVYLREQLKPDEVINGPAIIVEKIGTIIIEPDWQAKLTIQQDIELIKSSNHITQLSTEVDPIRLEVFNNLYMSIAEQMGATLANTAHSVNIKERLDFSCAIFDSQANLVANAPHTPVHLGSMSVSVKTVLHAHQNDMQPGDVYVLNNPYNGGTHLPDITVISPVFHQQQLLFFVASRGHHADIGGITPGSMPAYSTRIEQEGALINDLLLIRQGKFNEAEVIKLFTDNPYPARNVEQNISDLKAQVAANQTGIRELNNMINTFGLEIVQAYMQHVQDNAEFAVKQAIKKLKSGEFTYQMDGGQVVKVKVTIKKDKAIVDFTGSSATQPSNFNAPTAICRAAILYVFRTLVDETIPMNEGCLKPIEIIISENSMLNPHYPAAVVAGNVEISQVIVNSLFAALQTMAAAPGTMNNLTFGNDNYQYYETIGSGSGAGPGFNGADAVQTHMTNTRITDPEVLELRFPIYLEEFSIRQQSGGQGRWHGGNGVIRKIKFLETMHVSILSGNRKTAPQGMAGGQPGKLGKNSVLRNTNAYENLAGCAEISVNPGDIIIIETPGGGGYEKS